MPAERFSQVLVVEDSKPELELVCDILQSEGFEVLGCTSAGDALQHIQYGSFGVAVVDLRLPDFTGTQLLEKIVSLDEHVRVIIYTGAASYESIKEALNLGAFAYVEKLSDPSELLRHVHRACRERFGHYAAGLEAAVAERTQELALSNRELEDFASVVAHDLRSPLLTISGYCQILHEEYQHGSYAEAGVHLRKILEAVTRMNRLIEDLLNYSRVGRHKERFQPVPLQSVVAQALANLEAAVRENNAQVEVGEMPVVVGDQTQLVQLFQNLLGNAVKFRRPADLLIRLRAEPDETQWRFAVEDNGIGIEPHHFGQLFQFFQRLHGEEYPGTGMGLAVCKKIVARHGGQIWLESEPGRGTTFLFTLPRVQDKG